MGVSREHRTFGARGAGARFRPAVPWRAALLAGLAILLTAFPAAAEEVATFEDVLSFDPREARAACPTADHASKEPVSPTTAVPPNPDGPTPLGVYVFVTAIDRVSTATSSFRFEGYGGIVWCDPRVAFDAAAVGADRLAFFDDAAVRRMDQMWTPAIVLPTSLGLLESDDMLLTLFADGTVSARIKFNTRLSARYDFSRFPLDHQLLEIPIQSSLYGSDQVVLQEALGQVGLGRSIEVPEWRLEGYRAFIEAPGRFQRFVMEIEIGRQVGFYVWKILLPLFIITCVAWSTFWMTRDVLAQRQRQSATAVLTVVAFQFIASGDLPRVAYLTLMDGVILWTYICTGGTLLTNILSNRRFRIDNQAGLRMDHRGRVLFPLVYVGGILLTLAISFLL